MGEGLRASVLSKEEKLHKVSKKKGAKL